MFKVGEKWFFRTVTYHVVGEIVALDGEFIELKDAAWIADSGRFTQAINTGVLSEVEPVNVRVILNCTSLTDAFEWKHDLPLTQK